MQKMVIKLKENTCIELTWPLYGGLLVCRFMATVLGHAAVVGWDGGL